MVIITDANGTIVKSIPEKVYQGSNNVNSIILLAPFSNTAQVTITFKKPNGELTEEYLMTEYADIPSEYSQYNGWKYDLDQFVTEIAGVLQFQFRAYTNTYTTEQVVAYVDSEEEPYSENWLVDAESQTIEPQVDKVYIVASDGIYKGKQYLWNGESYQETNNRQVHTSFGCSIEVLKGVAPILPATPSNTIYQQILVALASMGDDMEDLDAKKVDKVNVDGTKTGTIGYNSDGDVYFSLEDSENNIHNEIKINEQGVFAHTQDSNNSLIGSGFIKPMGALLTIQEPSGNLLPRIYTLAFDKNGLRVNTEKVATENWVNLQGFITKAVDDLVNYYTKSQTYTKTEVNNLVNSLTRIEFVYANSLPTASESTMNKIYLVPSQAVTPTNVKDEYVTIRSGSVGSYTYRWELIGTTEIDLSNYQLKLQFDTMPSATEENAGQIIQYVGETDTYTKGYFYESQEQVKCYEVEVTEGTLLGDIYYCESLPANEQQVQLYEDEDLQTEKTGYTLYRFATSYAVIIDGDTSGWTDNHTTNTEVKEYVWVQKDVQPQVEIVTSVSVSSTDEQVPSAKCLNDNLALKQNVIDNSHKLDADLVDDTNSTNKFVTSTQKSKIDVITTTGDGNSYLANDGTYKQVQSAPEIDESSITLNSQDKLQAVGVVNTGSNTVMKQWNGTQAEYDLIPTKDPNTYYYITDAPATSGISAGNGIDITNDTISNTGVLTGTTAPTTATVGYVGQFYLDTVTQKLYKCDAIVSGTPDTYTWSEVGGSQVYMHNISLHSANGTMFNCVIYTLSSTPFTGITLTVFLYNLYSNSIFNYLPANGLLVLTNSSNVVLGIKATTDQLRIYYAYPALNVDFANETSSLQFNQYSVDYYPSSFTIDDAVVAL